MLDFVNPWTKLSEFWLDLLDAYSLDMLEPSSYQDLIKWKKRY